MTMTVFNLTDNQQRRGIETQKHPDFEHNLNEFEWDEETQEYQIKGRPHQGEGFV